ncbi:hypothetical protein [Ferribacterium limneticum]|uniref:hypothetical protein n=1 Tax=Ferribacterium limneticum TaxID=76259 RepID=UPI001CF8896D|nr:hypothetical protein [Ferribacterium limneticum]UCV26781.1 hypothetical protein KI617_10710 [Ferribacterium limneticum]UCV30698.1 hypothetical protein KI608_10710 [Ferribacterium limneticum]
MKALDFEDFNDVPRAVAPGEEVEEPVESIAERYLLDPLSKISLADRIDLYEAVKASLPAHALSDIDLTQELVLQFTRVKELQIATLASSRVPANQKAQVANSVASILGQLTKLQTELHTAERFKAMETHLIRAMKKLPLEEAEEFLREYERA